MLVNPPLQHHEAPSHWIPLDRAFLAIEVVRAAFMMSLKSYIERDFGEDVNPSISVSEARFVLRFKRWHLSLGSWPDYSSEHPEPPPFFAEREGREDVEIAVSLARHEALRTLARLVVEGTFRIHARWGAADADFRQVARDVWSESDVGYRGKAHTRAGTALYRVHVEPMTSGVGAGDFTSPRDRLKEWLRDAVMASPTKRTFKVTIERGSEIATKASKLRVSLRDAEQAKREVFASLPETIRAVWQKPGNSPTGN